MNVLLISNDYNFSENLQMKLRAFDIRVSHNMDTYESLRKSTSNYSMILIDEKVNDQKLRNITETIKMNDNNIPVVILIGVYSNNLDEISDLLKDKLVQDIGSRPTSDSGEGLFRILNKVYHQSQSYR